MKQINFQDLHTYTGLPVFQSDDYKKCRMLEGYVLKNNIYNGISNMRVKLIFAGQKYSDERRLYKLDNIDLYASEETESIKAKRQASIGSIPQTLIDRNF